MAIWEVAVWFIFAIIVSVVFAVALHPLISVSIVVTGCFVLVTAACLWLYPAPACGPARRPWVVPIIVAAATVALVIASHFVPHIDNQSHFLRIPAASTFITVAVATPIYEELIFRGWLWEAISRRWGKWTALVLTSLIFASLHDVYSNHWNAMPHFIVMGLLFGLIRQLTESVRAGIYMHAIVNTVALTVGASNLPHDLDPGRAYNEQATPPTELKSKPPVLQTPLPSYSFPRAP